MERVRAIQTLNATAASASMIAAAWRYRRAKLRIPAKENAPAAEAQSHNANALAKGNAARWQG
jgi:hypothetical protein